MIVNVTTYYFDNYNIFGSYHLTHDKSGEYLPQLNTDVSQQKLQIQQDQEIPSTSVKKGPVKTLLNKSLRSFMNADYR